MTDDRLVYELEGVSRNYSVGSHLVQAVREVDLVVERGDFLAVVGPSGSGKSTLLQLLGALDRPSEGEIRFEGRNLRKLGDAELTRLRGTAFGFVFQQFNLVATLTAAQNVEAALVTNGMGRRDRRDHVEELLDRVGLATRAHHLPSQLSGGEQQRVAIARALANAPRVILADEPTGNLDSDTGKEIVELLRALSGEGAQTIVLITHDVDIAAGAHRIVRMQDGSLTNGVHPGEGRSGEGSAAAVAPASGRSLDARQARSDSNDAEPALPAAVAIAPALEPPGPDFDEARQVVLDAIDSDPELLERCYALVRGDRT